MESSSATMTLAQPATPQTPQSPLSPFSPEPELHEPAVLHNPAQAAPPAAPAQAPAADVPTGLKEQVGRNDHLVLLGDT